MTNPKRPNPFICISCGEDATKRYYTLKQEHIESYCEKCEVPKDLTDRYFKDDISMIRGTLKVL